MSELVPSEPQATPVRSIPATRRNLGIGIGAAALLGVIAFAILPSQAKVDLVEGVLPMSNALSGIAPTIDRLKELPANQRAAFLESTWPHLDEDVVLFLQNTGKIARGANVSRVDFKFGSLDNIYAEAAGGQKRFGYIADQLVAVVTVAGQATPLIVLVQCTNGTFMTLDQANQLQAVGSHTPQMQFLIGRGEGLVHHLDYPAAIEVARRHNLPVYRTKQMTSGNRISYDQALRLESRTDWTQVTVRVNAGDYFDLTNNVYRPAVDGS